MQRRRGSGHGGRRGLTADDDPECVPSARRGRAGSEAECAASRPRCVRVQPAWRWRLSGERGLRRVRCDDCVCGCFGAACCRRLLRGLRCLDFRRLVAVRRRFHAPRRHPLRLESLATTTPSANPALLVLGEGTRSNGQNRKNKKKNEQKCSTRETKGGDPTTSQRCASDGGGAHERNEK